VRTLFDGAVLQTTSRGPAAGDAPGFEAHGYHAFDPAAGCYRVVFLSSTGELAEGLARLVGDGRLVQTFQGLKMGQPYVARSVLHLDADGRMTRSVNHSCVGGSDPALVFAATYRLVE
jgi:hypothetical protein